MINASILLVLGCICLWAKLSSSFILSTQSTKESYRYYDVQLFAKNNNRREVLNSLPLLLLTPILPANAKEMAESIRKY